jgi:hypothetical protein
MDEFDRIENRFGQGETGAQALEKTLQALGQHRRTTDRSFIVKCVVYLYVFSVGLSVLYLIGSGLLNNEDRFDDVSELVKVGVVPILTLVVGYYFGTERPISQ